jgi:TatD DNase family protein
MKLIDTHCHIHDPEFFTEQEALAALREAVAAGVEKIILIATSLEDSKRAIAFANRHAEHCYASIGIHPHEASKYSQAEVTNQLAELADLAQEAKVVAVGECGFDFYYNDKKEHLATQELLLRGQIEIALNNNLPLSFHVREAFDEFWRVFESYKGVRGVLHSFTDRQENLERAIKNNLLIGINGIATFTTHSWQVDLFKKVRLRHFVLETDAPFLTPKPKRGTINTPENVIYVTNFMAELRGESKKEIANATTANAKNLFRLP